MMDRKIDENQPDFLQPVVEKQKYIDAIVKDTAVYLANHPTGMLAYINYNSPAEQFKRMMQGEPELQKKFKPNGDRLEYDGKNILDDSRELVAAVYDKSPGMLGFDDFDGFLKKNVNGYTEAYDVEVKRIAKLNELVRNRIVRSDGELTEKGRDLLKGLDQESKAYKHVSKRLAKDIAGTSNPLMLPLYIAATVAGEKKGQKAKELKEKIEEITEPERKAKPFFHTTGGKILTGLAAGLMIGGGLYALSQTNNQNDNGHNSHEYWALSGQDIAGGPDIPADADSFGNVSFFPNPETVPVDVTNHTMIVSQYQWYNNQTGRFYDIPAWDGNISSLPDSAALIENATKDAKAAAYLLAEKELKRSIIYHVEYEKNLSVQKLGGLSVGGLGAIDVKARIGLINEGPMIEKSFTGGEYNVHNISFQPEFTVAVDPLSIPSSVCNIPILNSTARILADTNYLIDRSNETIGEYIGDLSGWDGKNVSEFLELPKANEFVNQTLALANGKSIDYARQWFNENRDWQPPAYGDVVIEKVNDTKALSKALIDMFPAKRGIENASEDSSIIPDPATGYVKFLQNPSGGINYLTADNCTKLLSDGWRFNKTVEDLGVVEPAVYNQTVWNELNASASKEAWDRVAQKAKANASSVDAAFAKIVATKRNATAWNYGAELFQKRKDVFINSSEPGNYDLKPGQRIVNETEFMKNQSLGYINLKQKINLDQLDLGNPDNVAGWLDLNASSDAKALKWLKRYMNTTDNVANGYYKTGSVRNSTDPNRIDSWADVYLQKPWQGGKVVCKFSKDLNNDSVGDVFGVWIDIHNDDNQSNDIAAIWYSNSTFNYNNKTLTAGDLWNKFGYSHDITPIMFEFSSKPIGPQNTTDMIQFYPYYSSYQQIPTPVDRTFEITDVKYFG